MRRFLLIIIISMICYSTGYAGWTPAIRISDEGESFHPRIVTENNILHIFYRADLPYTTSYYLRSDNGGITWDDPMHLPDTVYTSANVGGKIRSENNNVIAIWRGSIRLPGNRLNFGFRLSEDSGITWNDIIYILPTDYYVLQKYTFDISNGKIFFIYSRIYQQEIIFEFTKSTDLGDTWTEPTEIFRTQETGIYEMVARGDTIHLVWSGRYNNDEMWETYYIKSEDAGVTWADNLLLTSMDTLGSMWPSISINERGAIVVCWIDFKYSPNWWTADLFVKYSFDSGENWTEEEQLNSTHSTVSPYIIWKGDSLHIAWEDHRNGQSDIFYKISHDNGLTWGNDISIENTGPSSLSPDLAVSDSNVHVVWREDYGLYGMGIYYTRWQDVVGFEGDFDNIPDQIKLTSYPNPFNSSTIITYSDLEGGEIEIYDIQGQLVTTLNTFNNEEGEIKWDALDAKGNKVSTGIYFAKAKTPHNHLSIKLIYIR